MNSALANKLQIWGIHSDTIIFKDASLGACLEARQLDSEFWPNEGINSTAESIRTFLNSLPEAVDVQFIKSITRTPKDRLQQCSSSDSNQNAPLAASLEDSRKEFFDGLNDSGVMPHHSLTIVFRRPFQTNLASKKSRFFGKSKPIEEITEHALKAEIDAFEKVFESFVESIKVLGIETRRLSEKDILERSFHLWNPRRTAGIGVYNSDDVRDALLFTDVEIHTNGFRLSDVDHRVLSLKMLPEETHAGMAGILSSLPFESETYISIESPVQSKELESLQTQRRLAFSLVHGRPGRVRDIDSEAKLQDLESVIENLVQGGEKIFRLSLNIVLRNSDSDQLERDVAETLAKIRQLNGAEAMVETLASFDIFAGFAFPNGRAIERQKRLKTSNTSDFIPVHGSWDGHKGQDAALFRSRSGSLVGFDPFAPELTNANQLISGASGSGKSYLTNNLILKFMKDSPKVFIIDIGGSYKKLSETLAGQYIPLGVGSGQSMNPFDLAPGESKPSEQKIKFLVGLIETMTKEDSAASLPRLERAELEGAIMEVYKRTSKPLLSDLRKVLQTHENPQIKVLGKILAAWTGETPFGHFLDRPTNAMLDRNLICFDLKGLETHPDLQAACLFVITDIVWRAIQADRSSKKYLIFDECWRILESPAGASLVGDVFRTFRKYFASAIAISQTVDDFARSSVAHAIIPNSSVKWLLKQKGSNKENLRTVLGLNDHELAVIDSLRQDRGTYSEAFLMAGDNRSVIRVESTPLEYWISTTDPRDLSEVDRCVLLAPEKSLIEILTELSKSYPKGILAGKVA
ncbi:MAG: ATP-binding protein [Proteobacteria bacterium]|nr:ATP-binding protein [Pseudomonadota bacterium]